MRHLVAAALVLTATGLAAAPPAPAQAQAAKPKPKPKIKQLFPYYENYLRIPAAERTRFQPSYILSSGGKPLTNQPIFAIDGERREAIVVEADGRMVPPSAAFLRSRTAVAEAPGAAGRDFNVELELRATAAPAREMAPAVLAAAISETNAGIRKAAGPMGLLAPKITRVVFRDAGSGEVIGADGRRTPLPTTSKGVPYFNPTAMPGARRLVFARTPSKLLLSAEPKKKG